MALQHQLYAYFLHIGGPIELGATISAAALSYLVRDQRSRFFLTLSVTALLVVAFVAVWLLFTRPANTEIAGWTADSLPPEWARWRAQWEYSHLTRFIVHMIAFGALLLSLLVEPSRRRSRSSLHWRRPGPRPPGNRDGFGEGDADSDHRHTGGGTQSVNIRSCSWASRTACAAPRPERRRCRVPRAVAIIRATSSRCRTPPISFRPSSRTTWASTTLSD
jgi:hypothetical protein